MAQLDPIPTGQRFRMGDLILLSHKNSTWGIFLYINHKV
jgi:hypothetical protein